MVDPLTIAALTAALGSMGLRAFGPKGRNEQVGGPSDEDVAAMTGEARSRGRAAVYEGAGAGARAGAAALSRAGAGRGGAVGTVAGNVGQNLSQDLQQNEAAASALGARLRSMQRFEYQPSEAEEISAMLGGVAAPLGQAAALKYALAPAEAASGGLRLGSPKSAALLGGAGGRSPGSVLDRLVARRQALSAPAALGPELDLPPQWTGSEGPLMQAELGGGVHRAPWDEYGIPGRRARAFDEYMAGY